MVEGLLNIVDAFLIVGIAVGLVALIPLALPPLGPPPPPELPPWLKDDLDER